MSCAGGVDRTKRSCRHGNRQYAREASRAMAWMLGTGHWTDLSCNIKACAADQCSTALRMVRSGMRPRGAIHVTICGGAASCSNTRGQFIVAPGPTGRSSPSSKVLTCTVPLDVVRGPGDPAPYSALAGERTAQRFGIVSARRTSTHSGSNHRWMHLTYPPYTRR